MLRFTTAGESHGPALISILEGAPAGMPLLAADVNADLARRQQGYGRGRRMQIEKRCSRVSLGCSSRIHDRITDRDADPESRLGELAARSWIPRRLTRMRRIARSVR